MAVLNLIVLESWIQLDANVQYLFQISFSLKINYARSNNILYSTYSGNFAHYFSHITVLFKSV